MRPMLAAAAPEVVDLPLFASAKLDGIRAVVKGGRVLTRKLELLPNLYVQRMLGHPLLEGLDGELCVGPAYADDVFNVTQSAVMSVQGAPDFRFCVFDHWNGDAHLAPYRVRLQRLQEAFEQPNYAGHPMLELLEQQWITNIEDLSAMQEDHLERGYEGLILRNPDAPYKFGRSTANPVGTMHEKTGKPLQPWCMLKLKKFSSGEARVTGVVELLRNDNELEMDALGMAKRSKVAEGMVPAGVMGALEVVDCVSGVPFRIGGGFTADDRAQLWADHTGQPVGLRAPTGRPVIGRIWRYKHFEIGVKTAPRFPIGQGERDPRDMGGPAE
jgi:DNA ligase 1